MIEVNEEKNKKRVVRSKRTLKEGDIIRRKIEFYKLPDNKTGIHAFPLKLDEDGLYDTRPIVIINDGEILEKYPDMYFNEKYYANIKILKNKDENSNYYMGYVYLETISKDVILNFDPEKIKEKLEKENFSKEEKTIENINDPDNISIYAKLNKERTTFYVKGNKDGYDFFVKEDLEPLFREIGHLELYKEMMKNIKRDIEIKKNKNDVIILYTKKYFDVLEDDKK